MKKGKELREQLALLLIPKEKKEFVEMILIRCKDISISTTFPQERHALWITLKSRLTWAVEGL